MPRRTVYGLWHGTKRTSPATAAALLALRPLAVAEVLPVHVREVEALADSRGDRAGRRRAVQRLDLHSRSARDAATQLGVSSRTMQRWRSAQAGDIGGSESRSA